jgi:hypothetical protein
VQVLSTPQWGMVAEQNQVVVQRCLGSPAKSDSVLRNV